MRNKKEKTGPVGPGESSETLKIADSVDRQILAFVSDGLTAKEIADQVHLSQKAVEKRMMNMRKAIGAKNNTQLVSWAHIVGIPGMALPDSW